MPATATLGRYTGLPLREKLIAFDTAIATHSSLEIDSDYVLKPIDCVNDPSPEAHYLKVINVDRRVAYSVPLRAIMDYEIETLVQALETGVFKPLYGVTRIVGYYSRISNWNKSKIGELADRHRGNYRVDSRQKTEDSRQ